MLVDRILVLLYDLELWAWYWFFKVKFLNNRITVMGQMRWNKMDVSQSVVGFIMWPWSWTSIMTLNLDFRVQIFNKPYLRKRKVDLRCGTRFANSNSGVNHGLTLISFSRSYFEIVLFQVWMDRLKWNKRVMNRRYAYPVWPPPFSMILTLDVLGWIKKK